MIVWKLLRLGLLAHSNAAFRAVRAVINPELLNVRLFYVMAIRLIHAQDRVCSANLRVESLVHVEVLRAGVNMQHWLGEGIYVHLISGMVYQPCGIA